MNLWYRMLGFDGDPHFNPIHIASNVVIVAGFFLLSAAWRVLYQARREGRLATAGPYARVRHPQYSAFIVIMFGFLLQWPTLITLVMFPILVVVYANLAVKSVTCARRSVTLGTYGGWTRRWGTTTRTRSVSNLRRRWST